VGNPFRLYNMRNMLSARQEAARIAEFEGRYELVKDKVDELVELRSDAGSNEQTPGYIDRGSNAAVFKIHACGLDLAVRLNPAIDPDRVGVTNVDWRAQAMARSKDIDCAEQGYAMDRAGGIMVSGLVKGEPHSKRGARGGLWLFAADVDRLLSAQNQLADNHVHRDGGSKSNLLVGEAGLTFVDMSAGVWPAAEAEEYLIPELLFSFSRPQRIVNPNEQQALDLQVIAGMFESAYPDSNHLQLVRDAVAAYRKALEDASANDKEVS
jgi:hypothetical protein